MIFHSKIKFFVPGLGIILLLPLYSEASTVSDQLLDSRKKARVRASTIAQPNQNISRIQTGALQSTEGVRGKRNQIRQKITPHSLNASDNEESIQVLASHRNEPGGGMMRHETQARSVQSVTRAYIDMQSPMSSPLDLIANLPSVNVSNDDPSGVSEGSISSRGLSSSDMGFLLNGIPIASGSSGSGGSFIQNYMDSENIEKESMSPGSSDVRDPVTSAAAGSLAVTTRSPAEKFGGTIEGGYGSFDSQREFLRADTGEWGHSGITSFISVSHTRADAWRGSGVSDRKHLDFVVKKKIGEEGSAELIFGVNHVTFYSSKYPTAANFLADKYGRMPSTPINYAATPNPLSPTYYYGTRLNDKDQFHVSLPVSFALTHNIIFNVQPYYEVSNFTINSVSRLQEGKTYSGTQLQAVDLNGDGKVKSGTFQNVSMPARSKNQQGGIVASVAWKTSHNEVELGYWHENSSYTLQTAVTKLLNQNTLAAPEDTDMSYNYTTLSGEPYYTVDYEGTYNLNAGFIREAHHFFNNKMRVEAGLKLVSDQLSGISHLPGTGERVNHHFFAPMPHFSWSWKISKAHQVYINAEGDFRAPGSTNLISRYSTSSGKISIAAAKPKAQYAIKEELGYRYSSGLFLADISLFNFNISNRLLSMDTYVDGQEASQLVNTGGETIRGADIMLSTRPILNRFSPYISFEYLHARLNNNIATTTEDGVIDYLKTSGKTPINTPRINFSVGFTYNDGPFFLNASIHYTGKQYATFVNDESLHGYFRDSLAIGYHLPKFSLIKSSTFRLNFSNLTGQYTRNGVYSSSTNAHTTTGMYGHQISSGGSPSYIIMPAFSMMATYRANF